LQLINGYWEIEKVVMADGSEKEYTVNETIDMFELKGMSGFRKKVKPQFDGKYLETGHVESITGVFEDGIAFLQYKTSFSSWKEEILKITSDHLVLKNQNNAEYHYKKFVPFNITDDGKTH
jgi:hypothetical protein